MWDRGVKCAAVVLAKEPRAVRADEASTYLGHCLCNMSLELFAFLVLLTEPGRDDDEAFCAFLVCESVNSGGAVFRRDGNDGAVNLREVFNLGVTFNTLYLSLFWVDGIDFALEWAVKQIQ